MDKSIKTRLAFIENIEEFPAMPSVVLNLMAKLNDPDMSVSEIEKLINMDPGLVSYILKITNSLIFGIREEVYSISRAIILLGMSNLRSMITSYSIRLLCKVIKHPDAQEYIWNHSLTVAVIAKVLSEKISREKQPHIYVFGLLHDIGKIALYVKDSSLFQDSLEKGIIKELDFVSAEKELYGFSHIEAGYFMVSKLRFSLRMKEVVLFHHNPEFSPADDKTYWIISLANELAHHIYDNKPINLQRFLRPIQLSENLFNDIIPQAQKQVEQFRALL